MKDNPETRTVAESEPKAIAFLQAAIPFVATLTFGALITAVIGLFVYANVVDVRSRDTYFLVVCLVGLGASFAAACVATRRALEADAAANNGPAFNLLKKYRRAAVSPGADAQAGQYSIGEHYLRDLLGRRGA